MLDLQSRFLLDISVVETDITTLLLKKENEILKTVYGSISEWAG